MSMPYENATSGKWLVVDYAGGNKWNCRCSCRAENQVGGAQLRGGYSSCCKRCANVGHAFKHGQASERKGFTHKYRAWCSMLGRVRDTKSPRAKWYAGVIVHPAWESFDAFDADVSEPPSEKHTLDRIKNELGYVPGNVKWSTMQEQARNRRSNRLITIDNRTQCLAAWAEEFGIGEATFRYRLSRGKILHSNGKTVMEHVEAVNLLQIENKS